MLRKPIIALVPLVDYEKDSYWMLPGYMKAVEEAGGIPMMLPLTNDKERICQILDVVNGVLFTGGHDVNPELYGMKPSPLIEKISPERDDMEQILFAEALSRDMPILGICRGLQLMNVLLGGTLYQDLETELETSLSHRQQPPYDMPAHEVTIADGTLLSNILRKNRIMVNSCHHQGIRDLASGLVPAARSEDGLIEAVYLPEKSFVLAVQWHPEFLYQKEAHSKNVFRAFINSAA